MMKRFCFLALFSIVFLGIAETLSYSTIPIVIRPFTIRPANAIYFTITIPNNATNISVTGRFEASGGSGNEVEVYIFDQDGFINWENGHQVHAIFASGRMTQGDIDASIPAPGTYYLVYSNKFSLIANKAVVTEANLNYFQ